MSELAKDGLTGLPVLAHLRERLEERFVTYGVVFDIDGLVWMTDWFGFAASDQAIVQVGSEIRQLAERHAALTFRVGGDEFLVVFPDGTTQSKAKHFATLVVRAIAAKGIEYHRTDAPARSHLAVNGIVCSIRGPGNVDAEKLRGWIARTVWKAKQGDPHRVEVIADSQDTLPECLA